MGNLVENTRRFNSQDAVYQSVLAIVLFLVIPFLSAYYLFSSSSFLVDKPPIYTHLSMLFFAGVLAVTGIIMFFKFPKNISRLRYYIDAVCAGAPPEKIRMLGSASSDDLKHIENGLTSMLGEMQEKLVHLEKHQQVEQELRAKLDSQQHMISEAEQQRALISHLSTTCNHMEQSLTVLEMRLQMMKHICRTPEEQAQLAECEKNLKPISRAFDELKLVADLKPGPFIVVDRKEREIDRIAS